MKGFRALALRGMTLVSRSFDPLTPSPFEKQKAIILGGGPQNLHSSSEEKEAVEAPAEGSVGKAKKGKKREECVIS